MKSAFLIGPQTFEVKDVPDPVCPEDGIVLDVVACGICGSDIRRWKEGPPAGADRVTPGHEAAGVVVEVGATCQRFAVGDHVAIAPDIHCGTCWFCKREKYNLCDELKFVGITPGFPGGFAEKLPLTGHILSNGIVNKMPQGLSFKHAAISEPSCSVLASHKMAKTGEDDVVVILGAGPIGCLHIAMAKERGAKAVVSEPSDVRRNLATRFEPDLLINPAQEDVVQKVRDFSQGLGADIVICANPVAATQTQGVEMVRKAGKVILFGGLPKANPMTTLDSNKIHYGEIEVIGSFSYHPKTHLETLDLLSKGKLPADTLITAEYPLDQIAQAYESAAAGNALKVLITLKKAD